METPPSLITPPAPFMPRPIWSGMNGCALSSFTYFILHIKRLLHYAHFILDIKRKGSTLISGALEYSLSPPRPPPSSNQIPPPPFLLVKGQKGPLWARSCEGAVLVKGPQTPPPKCPPLACGGGVIPVLVKCPPPPHLRLFASNAKQKVSSSGENGNYG